MHAGDYCSIILPESCGEGGACRDSNSETDSPRVRKRERSPLIVVLTYTVTERALGEVCPVKKHCQTRSSSFPELSLCSGSIFQGSNNHIGRR